MKTLVAAGVVAAALSLIGVSAAAQHAVPDEEACPSCSIETRLITRFGGADGEAALPGPPSHVAVDPKGRYWVVFRRYPVMVFDSDGQFLRSVGTMGEGPGEFIRPWRAAAAGDHMVISEQRGRVTVFDLDFEYVRSFQLPLRVWDTALLGWPDYMLVNGSHATAEGVGFPLHLVDLREALPVVRRSFGPDSSGQLLPDEQPYLRHRLGATDGAATWSADRLRYRITRWNSSGELLATIVRRPSWFPGPSAGGPGRSGTPPDPEIAGVTTDAVGQQLWVFSHVPNPNWRQVWAETERKYGRIPPDALEAPAEMVPHPWDLLSAMVEVFDLQSQRVVVRGTLDQYVLCVLPDARVVIYEEPRPAFSPTLEIISVAYRR